MHRPIKRIEVADHGARQQAKPFGVVRATIGSDEKVVGSHEPAIEIGVAQLAASDDDGAHDASSENKNRQPAKGSGFGEKYNPFAGIIQIRFRGSMTLRVILSAWLTKLPVLNCASIIPRCERCVKSGNYRKLQVAGHRFQGLSALSQASG
jgi:hypothetical protein